MLTTSFAITLSGLTAIFAVLAGTSTQPPAQPKPAPLALVELFTSEGCSSCPPADELLAKLARDAEDKHQNVLCLAFQVDYWDYLGWKDRFASPDFTKRQRSYAAALSKSGNKGGVYTPQMIVNGADAFVGSDSNLARAAIDKAQSAAPTLSIQATASQPKPSDPLHVAATITGEPNNAELLFALVEGDLVSEVKKGENAGRTLHHTRVVRALTHAPIKDAKAAADLAIPTDAKPDRCHIVLFVQNPATMHILGATQISLPAAPAKAPEAKPAPAK